MMAGITIWFGAILHVPLIWPVTVAVGRALIPDFNSCFLYRQIEGFDLDDEEDATD
jgi:hypothetical protein